MKYALFIVEDPEALNSKNLSLYNFANSAQGGLQKSWNIEMLNAGVYLCDLSHGLHGLTLLDSLAKDYGLHSRTLFFDPDPSWVLS